MQYIMRTDNDCGPAALAYAANLPYEQVMAAWGRFRGNRSDSPWHHDMVMARLGIRRRIVTCQEICDHQVPPDRTVVLVHDWDRTGDAMLDQHWCVVAPAALGGQVYLHMGDGRVRWWTISDFFGLYARATPACAYVVGDGDVPTLTWYQRLYCWLTTR